MDKTNYKIHALMSCPRLGFTDNFFCAITAFAALGINMAKESSAYWEQSMARLFYLAVDGGADLLFTVDYDSIFTPKDVIRIVELMHSSGADAICATQLKRDCSQLLMTVHPDELIGDAADDGKPLDGKHVDLAKDLLRVRTAHFGLTCIRTSSLKTMPHPWFFSYPDKDTCKWTGAKIDADIYFWAQAEKLNWRVYQANNVRIGHIQRVITWPSPGGQTVHQYLDSFEKDGKPASVIGKSLEASGASLAPLPAPEVLELAEKAA
jgi:hypothetical protein